MTHECNKESDIDEIKSDIKQILNCLNGNGKFGLVHRVTMNRWGIVAVFLITLAGIFHVPLGEIITTALRSA